MTPADYDVVVIGGGPAGSCAAARSRQHDLRTLVVEKLAFPRFRIGESLLPMANAILREIGVWPKIEAAGFMPKHGALFHLANGTATKEVHFCKGLMPGLDSTYQVDRAQFDKILLEHARELGAEVWMRATVRALESDRIADVHHLQVETTEGLRVVTARWVIDASGRDNTFQTPQKRELDPPSLPKRVAVYSHFRGIARPEGRSAGNTIVVRLEDGWFWLIPLDAERTSVGLVTSVEAMRRSGVSPEELFRREVARSSKLRELLAGSEPVLGFHVTSDYSYFRRELARGRVVLVGDAAGFFDPIFSSGVYMSLWTARMAVDLVVAADAEKRPLTPRECRRYTREVKQHAGVFQKLIRAFYDPDSFSVFMCEPVPCDIAPGLASIVAGHARLSWALWWRFQLFLLICRAQRYFRFVPQVDFSEVAVPNRPEAASLR